MSRQLEQQTEEIQKKRSSKLVEVLEYSLVGALEFHGIQLVGIAIKYESFSCLMTIKAYRGDTRHVSFISSDSIANCFLHAQAAASRNALTWVKDKYQ